MIRLNWHFAIACLFYTSSLFANSPREISNQIDVIIKKNIQFESKDFGSKRPSETFVSVEADPQLRLSVIDVVQDVLLFLPKEFQKEPLTVFFEEKADIKFPDGTIESTPLSLITKMQHPRKNSIRMGSLETGERVALFRSQLSHEVSHLLVEWASRQSGVTNRDQEFFTNWSKSIYEGVADFITAVVTRSTLIGSEEIWFRRDIKSFETLSEARHSRLSLDLARFGLKREGLAPKFRVYREWLDWLESVFRDEQVIDPYAEGLWIAGQLWKKVEAGCDSRELVSNIIRLAAIEKRFENPQLFIESAVSSCKI